jgi:hypothetical protein
LSAAFDAGILDDFEIARRFASKSLLYATMFAHRKGLPFFPIVVL